MIKSKVMSKMKKWDYGAIQCLILYSPIIYKTEFFSNYTNIVPKVILQNIEIFGTITNSTSKVAISPRIFKNNVQYRPFGFLSSKKLHSFKVCLLTLESRQFRGNIHICQVKVLGYCAITLRNPSFLIFLKIF